MVKFILSLIVMVFMSSRVFAGDSFSVKVSVIIPQILELTEEPKNADTGSEEIIFYEETVIVQGEKEKPKDNITSQEESLREGEIVLVKTIVAK